MGPHVFSLLSFLVLFHLPVAIVATRTGSLKAKLEWSKVCYTDEAPLLWNLLFGHLPPVARDNVNLMALVVSQLQSALIARLPACVALGRALSIAGTRGNRLTHVAIEEAVAGCQHHRDVLPHLEPLLICLGAAHATGRAALFKTKEEEAAMASNARNMGAAAARQVKASGGTFTHGAAETSITFTGQYTDPLIRAVVEAATLEAEKEKQGS